MKKGFLAKQEFFIKSLDEKEIGTVYNHDLTGPVTGLKSWFVFSFQGSTDSVQLSMSDVKQFNSGLLVDYAECIGKVIAKYKILENGTINVAGVKAFKQDYAKDYGVEYAAVVEKEKTCATHKNDPALSISEEPVIVSLRNIDTSGKLATMYYDVKQKETAIGVIVVRGHIKSVSEEDAEYDYSSGMMNLNLKGGGPMYYEFNKADGCFIANYNPEEKILFTWKDGLNTKSTDLKKFNKEKINSRLAYLQAIANFLVQKRYL
ncbi:hypothetical protein [Lacibacter luteus]|nr:hypothetical protein [Lacibacter luteus]